MMKHYMALLLLLQAAGLLSQAPSGYWQQRVEYQIDVRLDDQTHAVQGRVKVKYFNQSPDTLRRVFFHLYWNAFQPNSAYAKWAKHSNDVLTNKKLFDLKPEETGKQDIFSVQQNGSAVSYKVNETILEVELSRPLKPGDYDVFDVAWQGQVPETIKRGGRNSTDGVAYTFTQWYPKMCAYDRSGWHADPYYSREFFGEFGSYKVNITLPKKYMVAATGLLKNGNNLGFGYEDEGVKPPPNYGFVNVWKFEADNVHDFAWSADAEYTHEKIRARDGLTLHFFYQPSPRITPLFAEIKEFAVKNLPFMEATYGPYLYPQFSFIQGGEWAMEYPMITLMETPEEGLSLVGTAIHEWMHNWYYGMLGNNENEYPWLDEGFASYAASEIQGHANPEKAETYSRSATEYVGANKTVVVEPLSTPANQFKSSEAYFFCAYAKGEAFLWQLRYIIGDEAFAQGMIRYHADWQFKHPTGEDFIRIMERSSGMELDWYYSAWIKTIKTIDYAVENVTPDGGSATLISIKNNGDLPMPAEILVEYKDGTSELHYIPVDVQYGNKRFPAEKKVVLHDPWPLLADAYDIRLGKPLTALQSVTIDPEKRLADTNRNNNRKEF